MPEADQSSVAPMFYTGRSRFLQANENFVQALIGASAQCSIHASEDIFDATGLKLWARGRPIDEHLLERLRNRRLRKPVELCVYAADPVATAGIAAHIEARVGVSEDLMAALEPHLANILNVVDAIIPSPTELLLLSVLRHAPRERMAHAALVCALALAAARAVDMHPELMRTLARAALLHDIGELYLPPALFADQQHCDATQVRQLQTHPLLGGQVALELARSSATVAELIGQSHERLDGTGYPKALAARDLSVPAQALLFAEAMAGALGFGDNATRRAAVAARMIPGEFADGMVNWVSQCALSRPPTPQPAIVAEEVGHDLRSLHTQLAQVLVLLKMPVHETSEVRSAVAQWLVKVEELIRVLRMTGVEDALLFGMNLAPQSDEEKIELSVLAQEMHYRVRELRLRIELARIDAPELGTSTLVLDLLDALQEYEAEPAGPAIGQLPDPLAVLSIAHA